MKIFFDLETELDLESQYWAIWNQIFMLKEYCGLSLQEQSLMTAEERTWYIDRYNEEIKKKNEQEKKSYSSVKTPNIPRPNIRR